MAFKASPSSQHQHCTDEAQRAETVLSAVIYLYIYIYIYCSVFASLLHSQMILLTFPVFSPTHSVHQRNFLLVNSSLCQICSQCLILCSCYQPLRFFLEISSPQPAAAWMTYPEHPLFALQFGYAGLYLSTHLIFQSSSTL